MRSILSSIALIAVLVVPARGETPEFDVVVFGATPGGVTAAVAAAREGAAVALVEPQDFVGGVMSGGLSFSDSNQTDRRTLRGLFEEIHLRIEKDYRDRGVSLPYQVAVKDQTHWTYEPHVAERVINALLAEAGVRVFLEERLRSVEKADARIQALVTEKRRFTARAFVDATYEGDLMASAGVGFTIGRESRATFGESLAGRRYPKKPVVLDPLDSQGRPLPLITTVEKGDDAAGDGDVMTYSFRLCLTKDPNATPLTKPQNYDPARYELVRRFVAAYPPKKPLFDLYPLPGGKFDGNNSIGGQISTGLVGGGNRWCSSSYVEREAIFHEHRDYTLGLLWFLASDPAVPESVRREMQSYRWPVDEFTKTDGFPTALYVREGRRMLGLFILTQADVQERTTKDDSIAIGSFPIDSHDVRRVATADGFVNEGTIFPDRGVGGKRGKAYQIPFRAVLPVPADCRNLLVPVALSCSHVAFSSIRVEPTWMAIGQGAGVAAAIAARTGRAVQDVPYVDLRERLLKQGQVLDLPDVP
ncbi:FAD-dependent oxidoreductase [Paludisphaera rhizosphaerae]|uniref:FAD-dependent oxidoreductase n=1 Tax=Paludisphaera rhizosphaerae TaxID=2711216 RepID=UPI0013EA0195|nr:FAD-dependent oxidoreductase [Paludisphaera rhizosphaerae]